MRNHLLQWHVQARTPFERVLPWPVFAPAKPAYMPSLAITRAHRLKRISIIEDPDVIKKILTHLKKKGETQDAVQLPDARAPPQAMLFD